MIYRITPPTDHRVKGTIILNSSKSIANRVLIIRALCGQKFQIANLSNADDTVLLNKLLDSKDATLDAGAGGTTYRFLTAFLATQQGREVVLTGSERMQQRPIQILVEALNKLGADITYMKEEGFPPLLIRGRQLKGGRLSIPAGTSSQYISALLMIAPYLEDGLELELTGEIVSLPYIRMTLRIMSFFGADCRMQGNIIHVQQGAYQPKDFFVEADWSAASYFYAIAALSDDADITLHGLSADSLQGDAVIAKIFAPWVDTQFNEQSARLTKAEKGHYSTPFRYDFIECPDLAQTLVATFAAMQIDAKLSGLKTLLIKETDRVQALHNELSKYGASFTFSSENEWCLHAEDFNAQPPQPPVISTYEDHRMAMAFAPLCLRTQQMLIAEPMVVTKSYPSFWEDLKKLGFGVEEFTSST
jgi:3-phosphoshikimate 1-carboxyvinyltransferase